MGVLAGIVYILIAWSDFGSTPYWGCISWKRQMCLKRFMLGCTVPKRPYALLDPADGRL